MENVSQQVMESLARQIAEKSFALAQAQAQVQQLQQQLQAMEEK